MKNRLLFIAVQLCTLYSYSQINTQSPWTWMKGDNTTDQFGQYGTQGVAHSLNKPGARNFATTWRDAAGQLWLFGGSGYGNSRLGYLNDLWKYDPVSNKWTWVSGDSAINRYSVYGTKGVSHPANRPGGAFSGISWNDAGNNLWLLGGFGYSGSGFGFLNALWKFDITTQEWTWMKGDSLIAQTGVYGTRGTEDAANIPGARYGSQTWTDQEGNLWLYGGYGFDETTEGILNDIWKYNPVTNNWTWMNGDSIIEQTAVYGIKGVAHESNKPGARYVSSSWKDENDVFWLFGGYGYDAANTGDLGDLWKYDPDSNLWTWVTGDSLVDQKGHYGSIGVPDTANKPGSRYVSSSWIDETGILWLFGGYGYDSLVTGYLNDLWKYDPDSNLWTWVKGDNQVNQVGVYGVQCLPDSSNKSGGRTGSVSWTDGVGNLWLFGGYGFDGNSTGVLNDLWRINSHESVLPVRLLQFTGALNNDITRLQWQTELETGFSHFNVQRSFDGRVFTTIGNVPGTGTAGRQGYDWQDAGLANHNWQKVFYRLRLVDKNGSASYSRVILFSRDPGAEGLSLFPNPAAHTLNLSFTQARPGNIMIRITDSRGALVRTLWQTATAGRVSLSVDISTLPPATYTVTVMDGSLAINRLFIKQ